ncbi:hypothetical protein FB45DRAFT_733087 [Roridomyces roridus]|uniref:Uncharacterized protein n=1 Tax=Roridomyces roridus TaxID=1738132 RepID=A0AAD7CEZ5_9AGAR|nr:hypothetical protein FB45DRAFT_733087 [Roridomyces roridus]
MPSRSAVARPPSPALQLTAPRRRKWSREDLLRNLQLIGDLPAPLPPTLPPSPPASRSASPNPPVKRKAAPGPATEPNKRPRTDSDRPPAPPAEDGELPDDASVQQAPAPARPAPIASAVPVRRPKAGKVSIRHCEQLHNKYHIAGRMLKYSGDARFWSTYPPSHKEYRALADPPPPNSPYYKHGGLIARLELVDALVCFTYSIWNREYCRRSCNGQTWSTIEAFLVWCKQKWQAEEGTPDAEKAFLGLIWMIEGFIHGRKLVYATAKNGPVERDLDKLISATRASIAAAAGDKPPGPSLAPKSGATPVMLPSPASLAPSANSTPTNRDGGTPSSTNGSLSAANAPHPVATGHLTPSTLPSALLPSQFRHVPLEPTVVSAMENVTVPIGPRLLNELKTETLGIVNASHCMNHSQNYLNMPIIARYFPRTFQRMVGSSLSPNEEHEPDFEDEEGELFWPGQSSTGEGLGWVCLMGKAMIKEFGKAYSYRGLDGVVPKPKPEEEVDSSSGSGAPHLSGSTPLGHNSPLPLAR